MAHQSAQRLSLCCAPHTLQELGGKYECAADWHPFAVRDGNLVSGQNPMSSERAAELMIEALK